MPHRERRQHNRQGRRGTARGWLWLGVGAGWLLVGGVFSALVLWSSRRVIPEAPLLARVPSAVLLSIGLGLWVIVLGILVNVLFWRHLLDKMWPQWQHQWEKAFVEDLAPRLVRNVEQQIQDVLRSMDSLQASVNALGRREGADSFWMETLYHIFRLLTEAETEVQLCQNVVTAFSILGDYTQIALFRGENELGPLVLMAGAGIPESVLHEWQGKPWRPPLWGVVAPVLAKRKPFALNLAEVEAQEFPWEVRGSYVEAFPLLGVRRIQGAVVVVRENEPAQVDPTRTRLHELTAWLAGRSLESLYLAQEIQEHVTELVAIHSLTRSLIYATSVGEMLEILHKEIAQITGPADVAFALNEDIEARRIQTLYAPDTPEYQALVADIDWRVLRWAVQAVQPVFYTPGQVGEEVGDVMFEISGRVMVVPLEGKEGAMGVLVLRSRLATHVFEELHLMGVRTIVPAITLGLYAHQAVVP